MHYYTLYTTIIYNVIHNTIQCNALYMYYNTIQCSIIQYSAMHCSILYTVLCTTMCHKIQYITVQYNAIQYNTIQNNILQYNAIHEQPLTRYGFRRRIVFIYERNQHSVKKNDFYYLFVITPLAGSSVTRVLQ